MTESEFNDVAEATLARVEQAVEASGLDVDVESKEGGILELEFPDRSRMIVNRHTAAREIWVAAKSGGFHFRHDGTAWKDTRDGTELFTALSRLVSEQSGSPVRLG